MTLRDKIDEWVDDHQYETILIADGFDQAFIGVCEVHSKDPIALFDYDKCIAILVERDGMEWSEAVEYMDFNVIGAWVGEHTPGFVMRFDAELYDKNTKASKQGT